MSATEIPDELPRHLFVGGLVAMGFDSAGKYLLTISHSGRGVSQAIGGECDDVCIINTLVAAARGKCKNIMETERVQGESQEQTEETEGGFRWGAGGERIRVVANWHQF